MFSVDPLLLFQQLTEDVFKYRGPNPKVRRNRRPSGVATEQLQAPKKGAKVPSKGSLVAVLPAPFSFLFLPKLPWFCCMFLFGITTQEWWMPVIQHLLPNWKQTFGEVSMVDDLWRCKRLRWQPGLSWSENWSLPQTRWFVIAVSIEMAIWGYIMVYHIPSYPG